ncbi:hypothetical protein CDEST_03611 [Colletotrichum destructivum]|uniref:Uncharacterized protein n=1 Tax=Colletotrichum destructivum TaxID=34406 RepID=A0AAX4I5E3_9PEZI|nr:hypothetical protein CDEST_03611 [Colletotrichum destructivum]
MAQSLVFTGSTLPFCSKLALTHNLFSSIANCLVASAPFPYRSLKCSDRGTPRSVVVYSSSSKGQKILI